MSDCLIEKLLLSVRPVAFNHTLYFVNFAVDLSVVDEIAQLPIEEVLSNPEGFSHVVNRDRFETF